MSTQPEVTPPDMQGGIDAQSGAQSCSVDCCDLDTPKSQRVVVTRHKALVQYLVETGVVSASDLVISHATPEDVRGRDVVGILPLHLAALCRSVTEVPMALTPGDRETMTRTQDLPIERVRQVASAPVTYVVRTADAYLSEQLRWATPR